VRDTERRAQSLTGEAMRRAAMKDLASANKLLRRALIFQASRERVALRRLIDMALQTGMEDQHEHESQ
jgi:hypothetical protein